MSKFEEQHQPRAKESSAMASKFLEFYGPIQNIYRKRKKNGLELRTDTELQFLILLKKDI